jgi:YjbE family integral membrane protein
VGWFAQSFSLAIGGGLLRDIWGQISQPGVWVSIIQIIWIDVLLSADNAVMIALACRGLPPRERKWGMIIGAGFTSMLLIVFTGIVSVLMTLPYLKLVSAIVLVWIAVKLLAPESHDEEDTPEAVESLWRAVGIVVVAGVVMSFDNVIAVAAVARGQYVLLAIGLAISIPMVIAGSALILALLERMPVLVWGGAAVLGWVAGGIFTKDPVTLKLFSGFEPDQVELAAQIAGAVLVVVVGYIWRHRHRAAVTKN